MNKKRNKTLSVALAFVIALAMSLGGITSVFALDANNALIGSEGGPALTAKLTKVLRVPVGTTIPNGGTGINFTFRATKVGVDNSSDSALKPSMPTISDIIINIKDDDKNSLHATSAGGIISIPVESDSSFVPAANTFPHAGVYVYDFTETGSNYTVASGETLANSQAKYRVTFYVKKKTADADLYVAAIGTSPLILDDGTPGTGDVGAKVDPTPGDGITVGDYSQMIFTNNYYKTGGGGGENPNPLDPTSPGALTLSKTVDGDYGSVTEYFPFSLTVNKPSIVTSAAVYKGYVVTPGGFATLPLTAGGNSARSGQDGYGDYFEFTSGMAKSFKLKHGEQLVLTNAHVGATFSITETGTAGYKVKADVTTAGAVVLHTPETAVAASLTVGNTIDERTGGDLVAYTNTRDSVTPTGINLDDLPYYVLILLAAAALAAYAVIRSRRRRARD
jgi:hypothetical protein